MDIKGCSKWCSSGELNTNSECYPFYSQWLDCIKPYLSDKQSYKKELASCYQDVTDQVVSSLGYYLNECNLGVNCYAGTGCFTGSIYINMFRSTKCSIMDGPADCTSFGPYLEYYLRQRIKKVIS